MAPRRIRAIAHGQPYHAARSTRTSSAPPLVGPRVAVQPCAAVPGEAPELDQDIGDGGAARGGRRRVRRRGRVDLLLEHRPLLGDRRGDVGLRRRWFVLAALRGACTSNQSLHKTKQAWTYGYPTFTLGRGKGGGGSWGSEEGAGE